MASNPQQEWMVARPGSTWFRPSPRTRTGRRCLLFRRHWQAAKARRPMQWYPISEVLIRHGEFGTGSEFASYREPVGEGQQYRLYVLRTGYPLIPL